MPQSLTKIYTHLTFSTKHRVPLLKDTNFREEVCSYLAKIFQSFEAYPLQIGGHIDHVHVLFTLPKIYAYSKIIGEAKASASRWIKTKGGLFDQFQWQRGYGIFSVGHDRVDQVIQYIKNQEAHHKKYTFQEEFRLLMKMHGIDFDEQYVWD